jgi:hypothetical protein
MSLSIEATPNYSKRTFTIRRLWVDGGKKELYSKYRTTKMSKDDFESSLYNTENDWHHFLRANEVVTIKQ